MTEYETRLTAYCDAIQTRLEAQGCRFVTHKNISELLPAEQIETYKKAGVSPSFWGGRSAFVESDKGKPILIGLPEKQGLLERKATFYGLNPEKLRTAGLTDADFFAHDLIHEINHLEGYDGNHVSNEAHVYALTRARFAEAAGVSADHHALDFCDDIELMGSMIENLNPDHAAKDYRWTPSAISFTKRYLRSQKNIQQLGPAFASAITDFAGHPDLEEDLELFCSSRGKKGLMPMEAAMHLNKVKDMVFAELPEGFGGSLDNPDITLAIRDAALRAENTAKQEAHAAPDVNYFGHNKSARAALGLRQLARAIDNVMRFSDAYYPPAKSIPGATTGALPAPQFS